MIAARTWRAFRSKHAGQWDHRLVAHIVVEGRETTHCGRLPVSRALDDVDPETLVRCGQCSRTKDAEQLRAIRREKWARDRDARLAGIRKAEEIARPILDAWLLRRGAHLAP